ncbi:hypothetical protein CG002_01525 [Mesoplasma florum]|uniref:PTS sugar transporter subunit IIC n=1 Tax=Mesoplasma florum TaxID=2151 RepID=UPI000BE36C21|nr:PTS transporter subunit EIIC [Mesoplasma florum]ATI73260.1 hypothetical protein CQZ69_01625 [Mesoplasma florum]AVN61662.1 hypothetical protein CG004_01625 [Mesoplasma florum]AVN65041.1 hypothetical protein CG002_01525 [Mesoplasma florum]
MIIKKSNQDPKILKLKEEFLVEKKRTLSELKVKLSSEDTYDFEKPDLKQSAKLEIFAAKEKMNKEIKKIKDPESFAKNQKQLLAEEEIKNLEINYYNGLAKIERKIKKAKKIDKKNQELNRKEEILKAKEDVKKFKEEEKIVLNQKIKEIEEKTTINKMRKSKNSVTVYGGRVHKKAMPILGEISNQKHLVSIRNAFSALIPLIMIASFITVIRSIPLSTDPNSAHAYLSSYFPKALDDGLIIISNLTLGLMSIGLAFGIGVNLGQQYGESPLTCGLMGFLGFILWVGVDQGKYLPMDALGSKGLFMAILASMLMVEIYRLFKKYKITIRMPKSVPPAVANSFLSIIPAIFYAIIVLLLRYVAGFDLINEIENILKPLASLINDNFGAVLLIVILNSLFWWMGVHGSSITGIITYPVWYAAIIQNGEWFNNGMIGDVPNQFPEPFYQWTIFIGGAGSVIGLAICSILFSKSKQNKAMGKAVFIPSLFNISEPMMFGFPVVLNIYFLIPFILAPVATAISSVILVNIFGISWVILAPWSLPAPIGAFLATGNDWTAIIVVIVSILVATLIYMPFYKMYDKAVLKEETEVLQKTADERGITVRELLIEEAEQKRAKKLKANKG